MDTVSITKAKLSSSDRKCMANKARNGIWLYTEKMLLPLVFQNLSILHKILTLYNFKKCRPAGMTQWLSIDL